MSNTTKFTTSDNVQVHVATSLLESHFAQPITTTIAASRASFQLFVDYVENTTPQRELVLPLPVNSTANTMFTGWDRTFFANIELMTYEQTVVLLQETHAAGVLVTSSYMCKLCALFSGKLVKRFDDNEKILAETTREVIRDAAGVTQAMQGVNIAGK